jgi:hypothetical protein
MLCTSPEHPTVQMCSEHHGIWIWNLTVQCWSLWLWNPYLRAEFMGEFVDDKGILRLQWSRPLLRLVGDWVEVCQVCCPSSMFLLYSLSVPTLDWQKVSKSVLWILFQAMPSFYYNVCEIWTCQYLGQQAWKDTWTVKALQEFLKCV